MAGRMVEFPSNGSTCTGYLATPESSSGPGVIVLQEWWGLVGHITDVCDRFAEAGFVALEDARRLLTERAGAHIQLQSRLRDRELVEERLTHHPVVVLACVHDAGLEQARLRDGPVHR